MMKTTEWKQYTEKGTQYRIRAEYGLHAIGAQAPYFSITGEIQRGSGGYWREDSGGCLHEEIAQHFPELAPLIQWHLFTPGKGPMHYVANAIYWWEHALSVRVFDHEYQWKQHGSMHAAALHNFKSTIVFGALPGEELPHEGTMPAKVQEWLEARLPALLERCDVELAAAGVR